MPTFDVGDIGSGRIFYRKPSISSYGAGQFLTEEEEEEEE
jgi:hypothetical protein